MKTFKRCAIYTFLLFISFISFGLQAQESVVKENSKLLEPKIDSIFSSFNDLTKPGATVAVVKNDQIIFKKGYGSANLEYDIANSPSTIFHIASVSKQFTVFSILLLEKQGKLSFDDDIRKHIPEVPDFGHLITLRHLAAHTSGMRDQWDLLGLAGWRWDDVITKEHILKMVARQKDLNFKPGEEYTYCNTGFTLLAEVVARVSGQSFAEFTDTHIFKPLKMNNTLFYDDHQKIVKNRAYSYHADGPVYKKSVLNYANVGATSLFTTVEDLALWSINFKKAIVGDKAIFDKMNSLAVLNNGQNFGGAYGQFVNTYKGLHQIQHGGADAGYRSYLGRFPDQDFAVMVFSNLASANPTFLAMQVVDVFLADQIKEEQQNALENVQTEYAKLSSAQAKAFSGHYWNEAGSYARKIYAKNDTLRYFRNTNNESLLVPISKNEFKMLNVGVDLKVTFKKVDNKKQMIVVIDGGEPIISDEFIPPSYSDNDLAQFTGNFYSPELATSYTIKAKDKKLYVSHARSSDATFEPAKSDLFIGGPGMIAFKRDKAKKIIGLTISTGRVRNLWFEKVLK